MANSTYQLPVGATIGAAWDKVCGAKGSIWAAIGISILVAFFVGLISGMLASVSEVLGLIFNLLGQLISTLLQMGLIYIGIQRAKELPINYKQVFYAFNTNIALKIIGVYIIKFLVYLPIALVFVMLPMLIFGSGMLGMIQSGVTLAGFFLVAWLLLGLIVTIYVSLRMMISMGFVLDRDVDSWSAIKMSFKASEGNELSLLGIVIVQLVAAIVGAIPLGIGLIWVLPFVIIVFGMTYKNLAGAMK